MEETPAPSERRFQPRYAVDEDATLHFIDVGAHISGRILDLSMSGCRIRTNPRFPVGIYRRVETEFKADGLPFRLGGVIQSIHDKFTTPESRAACERIAKNIHWIYEALSEPPLVLTHFDTRMENFVFADQSARELALIDWQLMARLRPGYDIAYFLGTSVPEEMRRTHQADLRSRYLAGLRDGGVRDYDPKRFDVDFRLGTMAMTVIPIPDVTHRAVTISQRLSLSISWRDWSRSPTGLIALSRSMRLPFLGI